MRIKQLVAKVHRGSQNKEKWREILTQKKLHSHDQATKDMHAADDFPSNTSSPHNRLSWLTGPALNQG